MNKKIFEILVIDETNKNYVKHAIKIMNLYKYKRKQK